MIAIPASVSVALFISEKVRLCTTIKKRFKSPNLSYYQDFMINLVILMLTYRLTNSKSSNTN